MPQYCSSLADRQKFEHATMQTPLVSIVTYTRPGNDVILAHCFLLFLH